MENSTNYPHVTMNFTLTELPGENTLDWAKDKISINFDNGAGGFFYVSFGEFLAAFNKLPIIIQYFMGENATKCQIASDTPLTRQLRNIQSKTASETLNKIDDLITRSAIFREHVANQIIQLANKIAITSPEFSTWAKAFPNGDRSVAFGVDIAKTGGDLTSTQVIGYDKNKLIPTELTKEQEEAFKLKIEDNIKAQWFPNPQNINREAARRIPNIGEIVIFYPDEDSVIGEIPGGERTTEVPAMVMGINSYPENEIQLNLIVFTSHPGMYYAAGVRSMKDVQDNTPEGTILPTPFWNYMPDYNKYKETTI